MQVSFPTIYILVTTLNGSKGIKVDKNLYERIESLIQKGETNEDFILRCGIGGTTNMSKWKKGQAISAQSLMLIVKANPGKASLDWLVFGHSLATDHSAGLVERIASEINIVLERAYSLTDGPTAGEPLLRRRDGANPSGQQSRA